MPFRRPFQDTFKAFWHVSARAHYLARQADRVALWSFWCYALGTALLSWHGISEICSRAANLEDLGLLRREEAMKLFAGFHFIAFMIYIIDSRLRLTWVLLKA